MSLLKSLPFIIAFVFSISLSKGQIIGTKEDSLMIKSIYTEALGNGKAYEDLRYLSKNIGHRLSGSLGAEMAVMWGEKVLKEYGFEHVYLQEVMVPHWQRGNKERAFYITKNKDIQQINILALGGSVGTNGSLKAPLVMVESLEEIKEAKEGAYEGKIVFVAQKMEQTNASAFTSYGKAFQIRSTSATEASKKGALGVIIRSLSLSENDFPNTGMMTYAEGVKKIPAATISTNEATHLEELIKSGKELTFAMEMDCRTLPDIKSYNVIAEIKGKKDPNKIITIGGHLDSWDIGEGAHDDGAGIVHSMEAIRILKDLNYKPNYTLRVVFFMNEENGNQGGETYAEIAAKSGEEHIFAIESDAGGYTPRGFTVNNDEGLAFVKSFYDILKPYQVTDLDIGYGGVDIYPLGLKFDDISLIGFMPDSQRYFDIHHNANDVFERVNKRELHLGCAAISSLVYLIDKYHENN